MFIHEGGLLKQMEFCVTQTISSHATMPIMKAIQQLAGGLVGNLEKNYRLGSYKKTCQLPDGTRDSGQVCGSAAGFLIV
jgi:hypothetical protein